MKTLLVCFLLTSSTLFAGDAVNYGPPQSAIDHDRIAKAKALGPQVGMTLAQVVEIWGEPKSIHTIASKKGEAPSSMLFYNQGAISLDKDLIVTLVQRTF